MMFVVEGDSEEELQDVPDKLSLSEAANTKATPLRNFE
jgi:hypothetical protein